MSFAREFFTRDQQPTTTHIEDEFNDGVDLSQDRNNDRNRRNKRREGKARDKAKARFNRDW